MPRMTTLDGLVVPRLFRVISTTSSRAASGPPSAARATWGRLSTSGAWSRSTELSISDLAPCRSTTTLSGEPVSTSVARNPSDSMSMAANTNTTSAMPPTVRAVVRRRASMLRRLYEKSEAMPFPLGYSVSYFVIGRWTFAKQAEDSMFLSQLFQQQFRSPGKHLLFLPYKIHMRHKRGKKRTETKLALVGRGNDVIQAQRVSDTGFHQQ